MIDPGDNENEEIILDAEEVEAQWAALEEQRNDEYYANMADEGDYGG